ncbi:MAG: DUF547 domain-containing protein [Alphaproteobacteria bacterium]|nr:DUF547 domain-containing protein [Alphaproteobacteria bacterium]
MELPGKPTGSTVSPGETGDMARNGRHVVAGAALAGLIALVSPIAAATPQKPPEGGPISRFAASDPSSTQSYSYLLWAKILGTVIGPDGGVDYGGLGIQGRQALDAFVDELTSIPVSTLNRDEQLAYWLNLYNAAWLRAMFDHFTSLASDSELASHDPWGDTRKFSVKRLYTAGENPWTVRNLTVEGETLSLNDIEYRILYPGWPDEPVAYGLSCPLRGCPALSKEPFVGGRVRTQLRAAAERFIADKDNVHVKGDAVELSELYRWNAAAFGGEARILEHLRNYAGSRQAELNGVTRVRGYDFDWKLAGKEPPKEVKAIRGQMNRGAGPGGYFQE